MAGDGNLLGAIEMLLALEKQTRSGGDMHSTSKILVAVVQMCYEAKEWTTLNEHLILISKKRSQLKMAVTKMVQVRFSSSIVHVNLMTVLHTFTITTEDLTLLKDMVDCSKCYNMVF